MQTKKTTNSEYLPWGDPKNPWKTESAYWGYIRGGIRRALWKNNPIKINFIREYREQIPNPNPRGKKPMVWGARCALCGELFPLSEIEVDHKEGEHSLKGFDDLLEFLKTIVLVSPKDLQLLCKGCHADKTYQERHGITLQEAKATRVAISLQKDKKDIAWLQEHGIIPASNAKKRREQIIQYLGEEA